MTEQMAIDIVRKEKAYMDSHAGKAQSEAFKMAIKALEEIQQSRALGTVEELRVARDKQVAKKCNIRDRIVFREGEYEPIKIKSYRCPICNHETGTCGVVPNYCMSCGQKLDWSDEDE